MAKWIKRVRAEQVIAEWEGLSGQEPMQDFCARHGISPETFRRWRIRLAEVTGSNARKRPGPSRAPKTSVHTLLPGISGLCESALSIRKPIPRVTYQSRYMDTILCRAAFMNRTAFAGSLKASVLRQNA